MSIGHGCANICFNRRQYIDGAVEELSRP